jgi:V-type H+-transporting ATPase subunit D
MIPVLTYPATDASEVSYTALAFHNLTPDLFPEITRRIDEAKRKMGRVMQIAAFSLAEVTYAVGGDIGYQVQESAKSARFRIRTKQENVSGVMLPAFEAYNIEGNNDFGLTGLGKGGQQVQRCRETYSRAVETLVELASLQVGHRMIR